ncbi:Ferric iron ABC transporter, iron-binding protein [hydrothermal vent metagenome]|uniref:Ferric iron ABC transporter, iron-binding protein n=1 Tax=hydrothermal vent metagenome TaxID=652676 RepID=A0A3B0U6I6_9ZZZZ
MLAAKLVGTALTLTLALALALGLTPPAMMGATGAQNEVNIYSYRQPQLVKNLFKTFTRKTGIKVNIIFAKKGLEERLYQEGKNSPADVLFTVGVGRLDNAKQLGVTQAVFSKAINEAIPAAYRDPDGHWFGLTTRARIVYASKARVSQTEITYEELAEPKWKGRICSRSGQNTYSIALVASMIANLGEDKAQEWLAGLKDNLAVKPAGNDRAQVKSVYSGQCDISIGHTYYMAAMLNNTKKPEQKEWAKSVRIIFPNTKGRGTHVDISGIAMAKNAPNRDNALKLMEWLTGPDAQKIYAEVVNEYPLRRDVGLSEMVSSWGEMKPDPLPITDIAKYRKRASELVDEVGFDDGPSS